MKGIPTPQEAMAEGASALRYRADRLNGIVGRDDPVAAEMIDKWRMAAQILDGMAGENVRV